MPKLLLIGNKGPEKYDFYAQPERLISPPFLCGNEYPNLISPLTFSSLTGEEGCIHAAPKSSTRQALAYSIERWEKLSHYTENGMLNIDINPVESSIRPLAMGRKNYLFAGSHEAAKRCGMLYSFTLHLQNAWYHARNKG